MSSMRRSEGGGSLGSIGSKNKSKNEATSSKTSLDYLTIEFQYYSAAIRNLALSMTDPDDRARAFLWINKLSGAEYHVEVLRNKRNRYLASLTINMLNDELTGIFAKDPPTGTMKDITNLRIIKAPSATWEKDTTWLEYVSALPDNYPKIRCSFHCGDSKCDQSAFVMGEQLDNEFKFLLYQIRPYASLMPCTEAKTKVAAWIQVLCRLSCKKCDKMRALRNDYAYVLYGYVRDLRVAGPFQDYPPRKMLLSLPEAARIAAKKHPLTSPYSEEAASFLEIQPTPEEGAFCYIAVTGEFADANVPLPP